MKRLLLTLFVAAGVLAGCSSEGIGGVTVVTSGRHDVGPAKLLGDVVILGGTVELGEDATVAGSVHVLGGRGRLAGEVDGDITVIGGEVRLEPGAVAHGDVSVSAGGILDLAESATVHGAISEGLTVDVGGVAGGLDPISFLLRASVLALAIAAVRQVAPRRTRLIAGWAARLPAASGAYGVLLGLVGVSLAVFMAFTIVLAPVALILLVVLGLGVLFGLAGVATAIEMRSGRIGGRRGIGTISCAVVLSLAPLVPLMGLLVTFLVVVTALGATGLSLQRGEVRTTARLDS
ncbi:MAG: polymer-forming cytoskeletal protein [Candidatus Limnocylindrales bacterium]